MVNTIIILLLLLSPNIIMRSGSVIGYYRRHLYAVKAELVVDGNTNYALTGVTFY